MQICKVANGCRSTRYCIFATLIQCYELLDTLGCTVVLIHAQGVFFRIALLWSMEMEFIVWWFTTDVSFSIRVFQRCHFLQARALIIPCEIGRCKFLLNIHINYHFFLFFVWHVERNKIKQTQKICWRCCNSDLSWMKYANEKKTQVAQHIFGTEGPIN